MFPLKLCAGVIGMSVRMFVRPSVNIFHNRNFSQIDEPILMKLYTVYDLRMYMMEYNCGRKIAREINEGIHLFVSFDSQF